MSAPADRPDAEGESARPDAAADGVLLVRLGAVGDVIHALPVAHALRRALPGQRIAWAIHDRLAPLLDGNPDVDAVIRAPRRPWRGRTFGAGCSALGAVVSQLRTAACSAAIDLQGLTKSALVARISGARLRVGFDGSGGRSGRELSPWLNNRLVRAGATHVVDRNLELLRGLGIDPPTPDGPEWFPRPAPASETVDRFCAERGLEAGGFVALHPGAGWPAKEWPAARFLALLRGLPERIGAPVVVTWGGAEEEKSARSLVTEAGGIGMMAPATDLPELWDLLARAGICIAGDTGPLHMAAAAGTPCAALFGPTDGRRNGPYGPGHRVLQGRCERHPRCWRRRWRAACRCMERIPVEEVMDASERLWRQRHAET
ncbi:MAG: glycosyltransferase family 9 protein [Planctomycetota bacterium]